jgi:O-methyltransferase
MPPHARLPVSERVVPSGGSPSEAKLFDINMLVTVGGQERTAAEYAALLGVASLTMKRLIDTKSHLSLIEAIPQARD